MSFSCRAFLVLLLAVAPAACHNGPREPVDPNAATTLLVQNRAFLDMTIYVISSAGQRVRLGLATGNSTTRFTIPRTMVFGSTPLSFLADPVGSSRAPVSDQITVSPGDEVVLEIPPGS